MRKRISIIFLTVLIVSGFKAYSDSYISRPIEEIFRTAHNVAKVRILAGHINEFQLNGRMFTCGISYEVEILNSIKSEKELKVIIADARLRVGDDYIVFVHDTYRGIPDGYMADDVKNYFTSNVKGGYAGWLFGEIYEISPKITTLLVEKWARYDKISVDLPLNIRKKTLRAYDGLEMIYVEQLINVDDFIKHLESLT